MIVKTQCFWTQTHTNLDTNSHTLDLRRFFIDPPMVFRKPCFLSYNTPHAIFGRPPYGSSKTMKFGTPHTVLAFWNRNLAHLTHFWHTLGCQDPKSATPHTLLAARIQNLHIPKFQIKMSEMSETFQHFKTKCPKYLQSFALPVLCYSGFSRRSF